jgi:hypothetical protein
LFLWRLYIMVLRGATSLLGALEGVGCCTPQNQYVPHHKNNRYINSYKGLAIDTNHALLLCHFTLAFM